MIKKFKKLKHRFALIFILFSLMLIFLISVIAYFYIKVNINSYAKYNTTQRKNTIIEKISKTYKNGDWDKKEIEIIGVNAIEQGMVIKVNDISNVSVWDAREDNNLICENALRKISDISNSISPGLNAQYTMENFQIKSGDNVIGSLDIESLGPFYYTNSEVILFEILKKVILIVGIISLIVSIIIGIIISYSISKPILKVIKTINLIAEGNYSNKVEVENNIEEINEMIKSVNKMANSLDEQEKLRKVLTRDISHELRTPLTTIQIQIEAIIDGLWEPSQERLKSIYDEMQRLNRLVTSLEKLSKYESDVLILHKNKVDIRELIESILFNFEKQLLDKNIMINLNLKKSIIEVDRDKISQVVINIFSNSIKYTHNSGKIEIGCFEDNNFAYIYIKDNGIGIDEKDLKHIFERFYRSDESRARSSGGIGVGLTISKTIVKAHGGDISVKSKLNEGSEFIIKLPK